MGVQSVGAGPSILRHACRAQAWRGQPGTCHAGLECPGMVWPGTCRPGAAWGWRHAGTACHTQPPRAARHQPHPWHRGLPRAHQQRRHQVRVPLVASHEQGSETAAVLHIVGVCPRLQQGLHRRAAAVLTGHEEGCAPIVSLDVGVSAQLRMGPGGGCGSGEGSAAAVSWSAAAASGSERRVHAARRRQRSCTNCKAPTAGRACRSSWAREASGRQAARCRGAWRGPCAVPCCSMGPEKRQHVGSMPAHQHWG